MMRVARRAGISRVDRLAEMVGLRQPGFAATAIDLSGLACLANADLGLLDAIAYRPAHRQAYHKYLGGIVNREFILLDRRRACPQCLAESAYHRAQWDLALATACPRHLVRLHDQCPRCRKRFGWLSSDIVHCTCGADIRLCRHDVPEEEGWANRAILDLVCGKELTWLAEPFRPSDRSDLLRLLMCLGQFMAGWEGQRRIEALVAAGPDAAVRVVKAGVLALTEWPKSVHGYLADQGDRAASRHGKYGARKSLGAFYDWVTLMEPGRIKAALADAMSGYVVQDPALTRRSHRSRLILRPTNPPLVALNEAAAKLHMSGETIKRIIAQGLLPQSFSEGRGTPMLIDSEAVNRLAQLSADAINLGAAASVLGVSRARLRRLVERHVIEPLAELDPTKHAEYALSSTCLTDLVGQIESSVQANDGRRVVGFETAVEAFRRRGVDFVEIVDRLRRGTLRPSAVDPNSRGFKRLLFDVVEIRTKCRRLELGPLMSIQSAAERLGLKWAVVSNLACRGVLSSHRGLLHEKEIGSFWATFVTGTSLAKARSTSPRSLTAYLAQLGVNPIVGPHVDGSRQNIFRRSDVDGLASSWAPPER